MRSIPVFALVLAGCAGAPDLDEPQDAVESDDDGKLDTSCSRARCGDPDAPAILFPGNPACGGACERNLASDAVYIPPRNGAPWGGTYLLGTDEPITLAGYSSGRIALLRRLALVGDGQHAVLLDPSWPDGARDFTGHGPEHGEAIVREWLLGDPARTFTLVYSRRSIGWDHYAALAGDAEVAAQVTTCAIDEPHLRVPRHPGLAELLADPTAWSCD